MLIVGCVAVAGQRVRVQGAARAGVGARCRPWSSISSPIASSVGDALDVRFYKTPELNVEKVPVRNDGKISLDLVGDVQAAGLGTDELAANLRSGLLEGARRSADRGHRARLRRAGLRRR